MAEVAACPRAPALLRVQYLNRALIEPEQSLNSNRALQYECTSANKCLLSLSRLLTTCASFGAFKHAQPFMFVERRRVHMNR